MLQKLFEIVFICLRPMWAPSVVEEKSYKERGWSVVMINLLKSQIAELMKIKSISCPFLLSL